MRVRCEKNSRVRYFIKKYVEDEHMAKPHEQWSLINRGAPLPSSLAIPWHKRFQVGDGNVVI